MTFVTNCPSLFAEENERASPERIAAGVDRVVKLRVATVRDLTALPSPRAALDVGHLSIDAPLEVSRFIGVVLDNAHAFIAAFFYRSVFPEERLVTAHVQRRLTVVGARLDGAIG